MSACFLARSRGFLLGALTIGSVVSGVSSPVASGELALATGNQEFHAESSASAAPFGLQTFKLRDGILQQKWEEIEGSVAAEKAVIAKCERERDKCDSSAAMRFISILDSARSRTGLGKIGEINRAFNLAIKPMSDLAQYGVEDKWTSPLATLSAGAGDCEDYAIAKFVALSEIGIPADDIQLVILRETATAEDHAVVAVRFESRWHLLDNRHLIMIEDRQLDHYRPIFAMNADGAKRFESASPAFARMDPEPSQSDRSPQTETVMEAGCGFSAVG